MPRRPLLAVLVLSSLACLPAADQFRILVMQAQKGDAAKYAPLADYLAAKGIGGATIEGAPSYGAAAARFAAGEVEAMVSGSAVAGVLLIKDLAVPVARPENAKGVSTYRAVVLARKGTAPWDGKPEFFAGKTVTCCALASSGEFFLRSVLTGSTVKVEPAIAKSHGGAIEALAREQADIAVVKDAVWAKEKDRQPDVVQVGADNGQNPDNTLLVTKQVDAAMVNKVREALLALEKDASEPALKVKESLALVRYIPTAREDYTHTIEMLGKAGVTRTFEFK